MAGRKYRIPTGRLKGAVRMTADNWLALFILSVLGLTAYLIITGPEITPEERESMEEEWWG